MDTKRALANLYELAGAEGSRGHNSVEEDFKKAINRETSETDTHPSPAERFRLVRQIVSKESVEATGMVWELFADREKLTGEMSSLIEARVKGGAR